MTSPLHDERAKWTVRSRIEKYNTQEAYDKREVDEVLELPGNSLTNQGVNLLWKLVAGYTLNAEEFERPFNAQNAHIGVGNNNNTQSGVPEATDTGLNAAKVDAQDGSYMYMKMDDDGEAYPKAGTDEKIVFKSTFYPGIACFNWYEWTIANGNGNPKTQDFNQDEVRTSATEDDVAPDPQPELDTTHKLGVTEDEIINLNHKIESMGRKYASATWIVTVEISLS